MSVNKAEEGDLSEERKAELRSCKPIEVYGEIGFIIGKDEDGDYIHVFIDTDNDFDVLFVCNPDSSSIELDNTTKLEFSFREAQEWWEKKLGKDKERIEATEWFSPTIESVTITIPKKTISHYPDLCPGCQGPSYNGNWLGKVDCERGCGYNT